MVRDALKVVAAHRLHDLPVVDDAGRVVGMLSTLRPAPPGPSILHRIGGLEGRVVRPDLSTTYQRLEEMGGKPVSDVMTTDFGARVAGDVRPGGGTPSSAAGTGRTTRWWWTAMAGSWA